MIKLPKYDIWPILKRVDFPDGYFDAKGGVHWMLTDAIGSVEMVVDTSGSVEQHTGYYPYGEPWRNPAGQPYLFGAKERRSYASLDDYDFHARFYTAANTLWHAPDSHAGKYHHLSPWTFCAANPIRYSDPTGMIIEDPEGILKAYKEHVNSRIKELKNSDSDAELALRKFYINQSKTIKKLEKSSDTYLYKNVSEGSTEILYDPVSNKIVVAVIAGDYTIIGHETNHARQYEDGELSFRTDGQLPMLYDKYDEIESYNIQGHLEIGVGMYTDANPESNRFIMTIEKLDTIGNGCYSKIHPNRRSLKQFRKQLIEANKKNGKVVEYYKGWKEDLEK